MNTHPMSGVVTGGSTGIREVPKGLGGGSGVTGQPSGSGGEKPVAADTGGRTKEGGKAAKKGERRKGAKHIWITVGNVHVRIYRRQRVKGGRVYDQFDVADFSEGRRKFISFADEQEARTKASDIATKLANRHGHMLDLTEADKASYTRALELLRATGVPLELAVAQFVEAYQKLGGRSLIEAVNFFVRKRPANLPARSVREVYDELLAAKAADGNSVVYLKDLKYRVGRFVEKFPGRITEVSEGQINEWLRGLKGSGRSRNNVRDGVRVLFNFAEASGYVGRDEIDFERVPKAKSEVGDVEIFTAEELVKLLNATLDRPSEDGLVPLLVLGAFAGLRTAEIERQLWSDVMLDRGFIRVTGAKGNTVQKRLVPIQPNLAKWLGRYWREDELVWEFGRTADAMARLAEAAEVKWKHNALRHSYGSYRLALVQDPAKVAYEMGNSPRMVVRHYREVVLPAEGTTWFGIEPPGDGKVVHLPTQGTTGQKDHGQRDYGLQDQGRRDHGTIRSDVNGGVGAQC